MGTNQGCPLPGQQAPPGQGLFYGHNGYECLNSNQYYSDIGGAVSGFLGWIAHLFLLLLEGVAIVGGIVLVAVVLAALIVRRLDRQGQR